MKRVFVWVLLLPVVTFLFAARGDGAEHASAPAAKATMEPSRITEISTTIAAITGIAISPLLGTGAYGAYKYIKAEGAEREHLPWFANPLFFISSLLIAGVCAAKDTFGVVFPPGWKKPLDIMEVLENKLSGLIAAGAVIPMTMTGLSKLLVLAPDAATGMPAGLATITLGAADFSWLLSIVTVPLGIVIFAIVWMASHAINVLILLSPWAAIDAALKGARLALLSILTATTQIDPKNGAVLAILIILFAYFVAGWSFRLTTFGSLMCWDFFTRRRRRYRVSGQENRMFTSTGLTEELPIRTYGRLVRAEDGSYVFSYRPWLILPRRTLPVSDRQIVLKRGLFTSVLCSGEKAYFILPPRYCGHEEEMMDVYGLAGVEEAGLRKAWSWLREAIGGRRSLPAAA